MSNYNSLKTTIDANIKQNGNQEITGQILNSVLNQMVTTLGAGYQFAGVATTATNPGTPDAKVFYIANGKGTYTNFGGIEVAEDDVVVLYWDSSWHKVSTGIASNDKLTELGQYVENPEWVRVVTDSDGKILYGVKTDGKFYFGDGCPPQVQEYVQNIIDGLSLNEYEDIVAFLSDYLGSDTTLKALIDSKLNAEGLDPDALGTVQTVENPEYIQVTTDREDKILEGIKSDGVKQINLPIDTPSATIESIDNPEWVYVTTDKNDKILEGLRRDGEKYIAKTPFTNIVASLSEEINNNTQSINALSSNVSTIRKGTHNPKLFWNNYGFSLPINNKVAPLLYQVDKVIDRCISYPDGTLFYSNGANKIIRVNPNNTEVEVLTLENAIGFIMIWMDSNYNIYVSPTISDNTYSSITGVYKLAYGESTFNHVLRLYNPESDVPSEVNPNTFSVWTMTEDLEGNLYAGVYGQPHCPYLYKSTDRGNTWFFLKDMFEYSPGKHIHFIEYNRYDNALYCTVGEINRLLRSVDGGETWVNMNVTLEKMKSCSIWCVEDGIILGSDYGYHGMMYKVYADGSYRTTAKFFANAIFSIRESDTTGWLYAFGVIDAATNSLDWYPPLSAIDDPTVLQEWIDSNPVHLEEWQEYYNDMINRYPEDAIRPQHSAILISKDRGESWEVLCKIDGQSTGMGGYFRNGECGVATTSNKTFVISEGKHNYGTDGVNLSNELIYKALNNSNINFLNI